MTRHQIPFTGTGVEVGVARGEFSEIILNNPAVEKLYSIDPWEHQEGYVDINNHDNEKQELFYKETASRLERFGARSVIIRNKSEDIVDNMFADNELDFAYIDANHSEEACYRDIVSWWSKVKDGGILAGHDYIEDGLYQQGMFGVKSAVDKFIKEYNQTIYTTDELWKSWYIIKNEPIKKLVLSLAIGNHKVIHELTRQSQKSYADKIGADYYVIDEQSISVTTPHWEKFQIEHLLDTYDRIIYLDADTIVHKDCPDLFREVPADSLGLFNEAPFTERSKEMMISICNSYDQKLEYWDGRYFNTGVMVISRCHKHLFKKPRLEIFNFYEQSYLNMVIAQHKTPIKELPYTFNRMSCMDSITGEHRLKSYIVHYAGSPNITEVQSLIQEDLSRWNNQEVFKRHLHVSITGGLGDQISVEPTLRFMMKHVYPHDEIIVSTHFPELFSHLDIPVYRHGDVQYKNDTPYRKFLTLPEPNTIMWSIVSNLLCHTVDFCSMAVLRRTLPLLDKTIQLPKFDTDYDVSDCVVVHAGRHWESKTFPIEWWQAVVDGIAKKHKVCLIGKDDGDRGYVPITCPDNGIDLRDILSLPELIAVIGKAKTLLSNDSAPIHIAGAFDNNIVLIPSCKHPDHILPWRNGSIYYKAKALYKHLTIDDVSSQPTEMYGVNGDKIKHEWSYYLPEPDDVINAI